MKKGFTLIELLIVMVVVSLLVTIAVPAYKTSMEKGRGLEGIANAQAVTDAINTFYIKNGNNYGSGLEALKEFVLGTFEDGGAAGITQSKYFEAPDIGGGSSTVNVVLARSTGAYTLTYTSSNGMLTSRRCTGNTRYCKALGFTN